MKFPKDHADSISAQQIRTYCCVVENGGYAGAQEHTGLAAPTMWEQVKTLEKLYQTKLFTRVGRNVETTAAGQTLYELFKPLLANLDSTFDVVAEQADGGSGQIRVCTGVRMMLEELNDAFARFHRSHPGVMLHLSTGGDRVAQQQVLDGSVDVALIIEPPPNLLSEALEAERLYEIEFMAVLPRRHKLAKAPKLKLVDLVGYPVVVGNSNSVGRIALEQALHRLGLQRPRIVCETDNSAVTMACVRAGMGIGFVAGIPAHVSAPGLVGRSLAVEVGKVHVVAVYKKGRHFTKLLLELLSELRLGDT